MARLGQFRIFDQVDLDAYFSVEPSPVAVAANGAVIPFAPKVSTVPETEQAKAVGVAMFASWLERNFPDLYKQVIITGPELLIPEFAIAGMGLSGFAQNQADTAEPQTTWGDRALELLSQYAQYKNQRELFKINIARAEQGLAPLEPGEVAPQVRVGLTADTRQLMTFGLLGLGAVFLLMQMRRR